MSKTKTFGFTDSVSETKALQVPKLSYGADYAITKEDEGVTVITNMSTPVDQPETIRFQVQDVANIYAQSGIDPSVYASNKRGFSLVVQENSVLRVTDTEDSTYQVDLPVSAHIVIKAPKSQFLTSDDLLTAICRCVGALFETDDVSGTRLNALIRGAMTPSEL